MPSLLLMRSIIMKETILSKLLVTCPFPEVYEDTEQITSSSFPVSKQKIGHIRADHDGLRWHNTVWPCHKPLATKDCCQEIDRIYEKLTAPQALKDLHALRAFCRAHMDACISKEYEDEFSFFYVGTHCNFWLRLITRKGDYNLYLTAYAKNQEERSILIFWKNCVNPAKPTCTVPQRIFRMRFRSCAITARKPKRSTLPGSRLLIERRIIYAETLPHHTRCFGITVDTNEATEG